MARREAIALSPSRTAPVSRPRNKARFKDRLEAFEGRTSASGPPAFIGEAFRDPLEHTTRR
jgi:hypothetical protein